MAELTVSIGDIRLSLLNDKGEYSIEKDGFAWQSEGRKPYVMIRRRIGKKTVWIPLFFSNAKRKTIEKTENGILCSYSGFHFLNETLPFSIHTQALIMENGAVDFSVEAVDEKKEDIKAVYFPAPFNAREYEPKAAYSVDCMRQGFILPDTWKKNRKAIFALTKFWRKANTGDSYMPLWGRVCGEKGFCGILEDANDSTMFSCYGKRQAFLNSVNWVSSLGMLRYRRTVHFHFYNSCDYNTFAKEFRNYEIKKGHLRTIDEKIKINPNVAKMIGTPVYHTRIYSNTHPDSKFYKKGGQNSTLHASFADKAKMLERLHSLGVNRLYMHTDGWGERGYDNYCPYVLPPCPQAGGYEGMAQLDRTAKKLGFLFGLHDQYRDFYYDGKKFDMEKAVVDENREHPYCDIWAGGKHTWLCASQALDFVETTYRELEEHDIHVDGTYLDVFSIMWGDECFHPEHTLTRAESIEKRRECFEYLRGKGLIVSSEEGGHLLINALDLVHHSPYAVTPQGGGVAVGIPVPMLNLVYHECVFVPWVTDGKGGWGIPDGDEGRLHCILNGQTPYLEPVPEDAEMKKIIKIVQEIADIEKTVYNAEMVSHKFLDNSYRRQQTVFSNGVKITVDFDRGTYQVEK